MPFHPRNTQMTEILTQQMTTFDESMEDSYDALYKIVSERNLEKYVIPNNHTLVIHHIPNVLTTEELGAIFEPYGVIIGIRRPLENDIFSDHFHNYRGFAFIEFASHIDALRAFLATYKTMNIYFAYSDRSVSTSRFAKGFQPTSFRSKSAPKMEPYVDLQTREETMKHRILAGSKTLILRNLPKDITSEELHDIFDIYGTVEKIYLPTVEDRNSPKFGCLKCIAYITFESHEVAVRAYTHLYQRMWIRQQYMHLKWSDETL